MKIYKFRLTWNDGHSGTFRIDADTISSAWRCIISICPSEPDEYVVKIELLK